MITLALISLITTAAHATPSTLDVKKRGEREIRQVAEPILNQYCKEQCQIIHVDTEVDIAIDDVTAPGFEETSGKATIAPASGKLKILVDEQLGNQTRLKIVELLKEHLETLDFPVQVDTKVTKFPQPASSTYRLADLRDKVNRDLKSQLQNMLAQFCPNRCLLGEFEVQSEVVNPEEVNYSSSQEFFQDGPAAIRVRGVKATVMTDQNMPAEEAAGIVEMAKLKVAQFKNSQISSQSMKFPKPDFGLNGSGQYAANGAGDGKNTDKESLNFETKESKEAREAKDTKESKDSREARELKETRDAKDSRTSKELNDTRNTNNSSEVSNNNQTDSRKEKFEHYEKIERVENGDAVQQELGKFKIFGVILSAIMLALLVTLVAIGFRRNVAYPSKSREGGKEGHEGNGTGASARESGSALTGDERASLLAKRIEADRIYNELVMIYSEHPKVAKNAFTHILTEEGVEVTAQYLEIFGESVVMDLLRDPGLQSDLSELMDFYARNTFEINDDERLQLLKKAHHRTVSAKMQVHGSRSAVLFDFLADMDTPQVVEMIKNESNTVKAIVLTQCDQKKRQVLFNAHDESTRMKLMTELSRIDHLPKSYVYNVASALKRKKMENPKLNTEALPGTDVLVSFLEKSNINTQRMIVQQLMSTAGIDAVHNLKAKLVSIETLRFIKDQQMTEVITNIKHDELVQFMKGCSEEVRRAVLEKGSQDLAADLRDELTMAEPVSREAYTAVERKVLNRIKVMANNGQINLADVNERIFTEEFGLSQYDEVGGSDMSKVG